MTEEMAAEKRNHKMYGRASVIFDNPPYILSAASIVGKKEGEGPLGGCFDRIEADSMLGKKTWEQAESELQMQASKLAIEKSGLQSGDIRYYFGGDLLAQLIATSFGSMNLEFPMFGIYGACSTMGEAMGLGAMTVEGGFADNVIVTASSHFASAEKQFRFPLEYGNQRPYSATWTVTGCGSVIIGKKREPEREYGGRREQSDGKNGAYTGADGNASKAAYAGSGRTGGQNAAGGIPNPLAKICGMTTGKIVDMAVRDSMNMGAAMAMAALDTIVQNFRDLGVRETYYDRIVTGDLGQVGRRLLLDYLMKSGYDIADRHLDCGILIFDGQEQDTHAGGSGCGCSAAVLCGYILPRIQSGEWKRVLFLPTGALLSTVSYNEGLSVPGIAHAVILEHDD